MNGNNKVEKIVEKIDPNRVKCTRCGEYVEKENMRYVLDFDGTDNVPICSICLSEKDEKDDGEEERKYDEYQEVTVYVDCEGCFVEYIDLNGDKQRMELDAEDDVDAKCEASALLDYPEEKIQVEYL